jgi:hypothetical protein
VLERCCAVLVLGFEPIRVDTTASPPPSQQAQEGGWTTTSTRFGEVSLS